METSAQVLTVSFAVKGYRVLASREYHSNIIGRHSYTLIGVDPSRLPGGHRYPVDAAGFMDAESVFTHYSDLGPGSVIVYDLDASKTRLERIPSIEPETRKRLLRQLQELGVEPVVEHVVEYLSGLGVRLIGVSFREMLASLRERSGLSYAAARRYTSMIVASAVAALAGLSIEELAEGLRYRFRGREKLIEQNLYLASKVYDVVGDMYGAMAPPEPVNPPEEYMVVTGNEAVGIGKVVAGVGLQSYYPITPAQDESFYLEAHEDSVGMVVFQAEDELAAIAVATGAALTGARAATATSGPGFDLMIEGLGWACINETPVVVTLYQRGGPSTGLPTRGSQEDLLDAAFAGHGECPRVIMASWSHEEALFDAVEAQNVAEKYQLPVIHLLDKFLANSVATITVPRVEGSRIERGAVVPVAGPGYRRFSLPGPISPRAFIGNAVMWHTGDEHDEFGHITEEPETRKAMVRKRFEKLCLVEKEIPEEGIRAELYPNDADLTRLELLIHSWGTAARIAADAVDILRSNGVQAALLRIHYFSPYPASVVAKLVAEARKAGALVVDVEHNYMAQAARLAKMHAGVDFDAYILKYTGRPIYVNELLSAIKTVKERKVKEVHLDYGA